MSMPLLILVACQITVYQHPHSDFLILALLIPARLSRWRFAQIVLHDVPPGSTRISCRATRRRTTILKFV
jgi:hypothetical protein